MEKIVTKITGDEFVYSKINSEKALSQFTEYLSSGRFIAENAEIVTIEEGAHPAQYLKLDVKAFPGLDVEGHEWHRETFAVWIELE